MRIVGTHFDLTERKRAEAALRESEERLTLAFAGAQEGVYDWNLETGAVVYSTHWKRMLGYEDHEIEPHVSAFERLIHPDDLARATRVNTAVSRGDTPVRDGVPAAAQGRPLRPRAVARISGAPRTRRPGRAHRRHAFRSDRTQAGGRGARARAQRARAHGAPRPDGVCAGRRTAAHRARDARSVRRAADGARTAHPHAQGSRGRPRRSVGSRSTRSSRWHSSSIATSIIWSGSCGRPRSTISGLRAALANYIQDWSLRVTSPQSSTPPA